MFNGSLYQWWPFQLYMMRIPCLNACIKIEWVLHKVQVKVIPRDEILNASFYEATMFAYIIL